MNVQSLCGNWKIRQLNESEWLPAVVPGGVHTDLLAAGKIPDPFEADYEKQVQWVADADWEYKLVFNLDQDICSDERIYLVADGLDTLAEVRLNGERVGCSDNMFRGYRWEVGAVLQESDNELVICFDSPVKYIAAKQGERPMQGVTHAIEGAPHIRKAPCHFGWDWGPKLPAIGIWRDIRLESYSSARLDDVHLVQEHHEDGVTVRAAVQVESWDQSELSAHLRVITSEGAILEAVTNVVDQTAELQVEIADPQLWWPNGYGFQPLYQVEVSLSSDAEGIDRRNYQIGLRTIELRQETDKWGQSFRFVVNGVLVFAKGSNWIPADSFPARVSNEHLERLIRAAAETHHNMLRVWGGGYYEDERFYDLCDRYGILVWQDFMFSCSIYPLDDEEFLANVKSEVEDNLRRIRHRACLALWCGNNEMDWGWESWGWSKLDGEDMIVEYLESSPSLRQYLSLLEHRQVHPEWETLRAAYKTFFYKTLPGWVSELDPHTSYWPSSPSSNTPFVDSNGVAMGNTHNWDVWHGGQPFEGYREHPSRFVSEFGFQSLPAIKTICSYAEEADWNMTSYIMEHHQRNEAGNRKIMTYLGDHFRFPKDFPSLVYLTQIQQAEAMRIGVEYWRRNRVCTSGTLYWQLNDCWPVASWSSLDYYGRWKALHYATRRFFAPMLLSIEDRGTRIEVHVTSDLTEIWEGKLDWRLETLRGEVLSGGVAPVIAPPLSNHPMLSMDFRERISDQESRELIFTCELRQDDEILATRIATFAPDKHLALEDPEIWVDSMIMGDNLVFKLTAGSLARFVWLEMEGVDLVFSDNYFDLPANREITVAALIPEGWGLERAQTALKVRSLYDSF